MRKNLFFYLFAVMCTASLFSSCSDDDDNGTVIPVDEEIAGKYKGTLDVGMIIDETTGNIMSMGTTLSQIITVTKAGENSVDLSISDFSFSGLAIGNIYLYDCELTPTNETGVYTFKGTTNVSIAGLTADVAAEGVFDDGDLDIDLDIDAMLGTTAQHIVVYYTGSKLSGSESSETKINSFIFDRAIADVDSLVVVQPTIDETNKTITFMVADTAKAEYLTALVPDIQVSAGATVTPASGEAQDFSEGKQVVYTVTAEDGTKATYTAYIASKVFKADFEDWVAGVKGKEENMTFYEPVGWASSNTGAHFLKGFGMADSYVVMQTDDAHSGNSAALVKSIDTRGADLYIAKAPKVTTGSLFLGTFITDVMSTLNSTKFGIPYSSKPISLKGWYKYTPGPVYYIVEQEPYTDYCHLATEDDTKTDQFAISVVLYETDEYDTEDWSDCLTGVSDTESNIYTSSRVAAIGQLFGGEQTEWKEFNLDLEWKKEYDATKNYRMTIVCSSSKDGDKFWGAPESTLIVDDFELIVE